MKIRAGVFGFLLGIAVLAVSSPEIYGEEKVHTVQKGETLYSIARSLGVKAEDLMKYNGISDPSRLQAGHRLKIPVAVSAGSSVLGLTSYRVVRGDTFYSIARKFSVTVEAIRQVNTLPANYVLREGDSLRLPTEARLPIEARLPAEVKLPAEAATPATAGAETKTVNPPGINSPGINSQGTASSRGTSTQVSWPVVVRELSYMTGKLSGVVITGARAESVKNLTRGTVLSAGPYRGFGKVAIIQVEGGYLYVYGGCESLSVKEGDKVSPGTELGKLGIDAVSNKPQLFFMVYRSNSPVDPAKAPRA